MLLSLRVWVLLVPYSSRMNTQYCGSDCDTTEFLWPRPRSQSTYLHVSHLKGQNNYFNPHYRLCGKHREAYVDAYEEQKESGYSNQSSNANTVDTQSDDSTVSRSSSAYGSC